MIRLDLYWKSSGHWSSYSSRMSTAAAAAAASVLSDTL